MSNFPGFKVDKVGSERARINPEGNQLRDALEQTSRTLLKEYLSIRQRAVMGLLADGHSITDLILIPDGEAEYLWNFRLKNGWKFTQKFSDLFLEGKAELTYVAERITQLPEKLKKI